MLPPYGRYHVFNMVGCPIRTSVDQFLFADPHSFSQLITSFFASESLGILHTLFLTSFNSAPSPMPQASSLGCPRLQPVACSLQPTSSSYVLDLLLKASSFQPQASRFRVAPFTCSLQPCRLQLLLLLFYQYVNELLVSIWSDPIRGNDSSRFNNQTSDNVDVI